MIVSAEMTLRDLLARRAVLALLFLVPLTFYLARRGDFSGQAIRFACLGLAWAVSTVALFSTTSARALEPRLRLAGHSTASLFLGRLAAALALGVGTASVYAVVVTLDQETLHPWAVVAALLASGAVAAPLGVLVATLVPRDLEGMLVLIAVVGLQMIIDPARRVAELLPLWSTRELIGYGVDGVGDLDRALAHGAAYGLAMVLVAGGVTAWRLRRRRHVRVP